MTDVELIRLGEEISRATKVIAQCLERGKPTDLLSQDVQDETDQLKAARKVVLNSTVRLRQLVTGPFELHQQMVINVSALYI